MQETSNKCAVYLYSDCRGGKEAVLCFKRDWLLYDVMNYSFIEGTVMQTDDVTLQHTVKDVGEEGNVDRVTRMLDLAVAKSKEMLYPFSRSEISNHELDDRLREEDVYVIVLSLPASFSQTTLDLLEKLIHEYIVDYTVADWMSITNPAKAETWAVKAQEMEREVGISLHSRIRRVRRVLSVF